MPAGSQGHGQIGIHARGDRVEVHVAQEVDLQSEPRVRAALDRAARRSPRTLVIDFCSSRFVGAPAIRLALGAWDKAAARGGRVIVRGRQDARRLFRIGGAPDAIELEDCP